MAVFRSLAVRVLFLSLLVVPTGAFAQWVDFADETSTRLTAAPSLGTADIEEKDYAWGDVDKDGDTDLVVVRKTPFTSAGKRANVLFMNENDVLVDRTAQFASASDTDQGFLTATNDRDVQLVDVNNDTWLDIVTAVTLSDGDSKAIGHPRVYINLGEDAGNNWLGFRHEDSRIPTMLSYSGQSNFNPRFCSLAVGDVTGDGFADLWLGDYDSSGASGLDQPAGADYNDRLLVNDGTGNFLDLTQARFSGLVPIPNATDQSFEVSAFGAAAAIADINGDGFQDIVKQTSLTAPLYVGIAYNDPGNEGFFDTFEVVNQLAPYFVSVGDLNKDGKLDLVITDDGADRYMINQGNGVDGLADFLSFTFSYDAAGDDSFGSNSVIADLNNDTWNDVLIADVDVDIGGCDRRMHIFRNLGGPVGGNLTLQEQTTGSGCANGSNPASCLVASIPANKLQGVHDVAVFDIDDDGWLDLVVGRCGSTEIYMNQPPIGLTFSYPQGLPFFVDPGQSFVFQVQVGGFGGAVHDPGTAKLFTSIAGGPFTEQPLVDLGADLYQATLPAAPACTDTIEFYFTADAIGGGTFEDPSGAPTETFGAIAAIGSQTVFLDDIENDVSGWTVINDAALTSGGWEQAAPNGTLSGGGVPAAPDEDADNAIEQILAFVTENGAPGGAAGTADVDGGPTDLISPVFNLAGTDGTVTYTRWFFSDGDDSLDVSVSADGVNWELVESVTFSGTENDWTTTSFRVGDFVTPSATVQVRFRANDNPNNDVTEAGIDTFRVDEFVCIPCTLASECDDFAFCNGVEDCVGGFCVSGAGPCTGQQCDEVGDTCVACVVDAHCADGDFCNGDETCVGNACQPGTDPCGGGLCDEGGDVCVDCLVNGDCDDGQFCNGPEQCSAGACTAGPLPCPGLCDEGGDSCIGNVLLQPKMGEPISGLSQTEINRFTLGKRAFNSVLDVGDGLGPIFNQNSCGTCHNNPIGGSGSIMVTQFGFSDDKGGGFDPLAGLGGGLLQLEAITPTCNETIPPEANVTTNRLTNSTLGFGLVEAIPDATLQAAETTPPAGVSGRAHIVELLESPGTMRVGRFGWKSQVATVLSFSGDASRNEMGLTNRLIPTENAPNGDLVLLATCDTVADPEDGPDAEGMHFIDRVTDFQRFTAPPPQTPRSGMTGEALFNNIGCAACHTPSFITPDDPLLEDALRNKQLKPYSDFLIHDMGSKADFIEQGDAGQRELRTTPLWGLRVRDPLWHDGRFAGGTFTSRVRASIISHRSLGPTSESTASARAFGALSPTEEVSVLNFLASLGRAEFDFDGDGDVDAADQAEFLNCETGPGNFYVPDDPCSVMDVDQDGDVDDDDEALLPVAVGSPSGRIPNGTTLPGNPLTVRLEGNGDVTVEWDPSCVGSDNDFALYEGSIGDFTSHTPVLCSTGGTTSHTYDAGDSVYFLAVPNNGEHEGSYGNDSANISRTPQLGACHTQASGACE